MQLQHFTDGNVPPGMVNAPDGWSADPLLIVDPFECPGLRRAHPARE
jgi:hypothetical protein